MSDKNDNQIFPALTRALGDYLSDEEGNITRNRVISIGAMAIVLGMLCSMDVFAKHRSHSSHSSHVSGSRSSSNHYSHVSHSSHVSGAYVRNTTSPAATTTANAATTSAVSSNSSVSTSTAAKAAVVTPTSNTITASDAVNRAYQKYVTSGYSSGDAMTRVNNILPQLQAAPANYDSIVSADIASAKNAVAASAAAAATPTGYTAEQAVQQAYSDYIGSGLSSNDAMTRINNLLPQIQANPSNVKNIVAADLAGVSDVTATGGATAVLLTAEQAVQQAYALYIQAGLDSAAAMTRVQAILAQIVANPSNYLAIVQADLAALGITIQ